MTPDHRPPPDEVVAQLACEPGVVHRVAAGREATDLIDLSALARVRPDAVERWLGRALVVPPEVMMLGAFEDGALRVVAHRSRLRVGRFGFDRIWAVEPAFSSALATDAPLLLERPWRPAAPDASRERLPFAIDDPVVVLEGPTLLDYRVPRWDGGSVPSAVALSNAPSGDHLEVDLGAVLDAALASYEDLPGFRPEDIADARWRLAASLKRARPVLLSAKRAHSLFEAGGPANHKPPFGTEGRHLIIELRQCDRRRLDDVTLIDAVIQRAARATGATVLTTFTHPFEPQGVAGVCVLAESHLSIHTWPEHGYAAADVFTCGGRCEPTRAISVLREALGAEDVEWSELKRGGIQLEIPSTKQSPD